jgi:hypothetical protein
MSAVGGRREFLAGISWHDNIIVGYFTGYLVNGNRAMIEINIFSEENESFQKKFR